MEVRCIYRSFRTGIGKAAKTEWVKDHSTVKRRRYARPESEWIKQDRDDLRMVHDCLCEAARASGGAGARPS